MTRPLYAAAAHEAKPTSGDWHKGLWYERFVDIYAQNGSAWSIPKPVDGNSPKSIWIEKVTGPTGNTKELERHALNLLGRVAWLKGELGVFKSDWNFVTGLGNPHPVENGFLWHPTLGVPYLPGSSVKGLLRAWVEHWDDTLTPDIKKARCLTWFGTEAKEDIPDQTGRLIFFDALPVKEVTLAQDVMTPHYGDWYEQGGEIGNANVEHNKVPADWHDPVPVPFLVVKEASWLFAIAPRKPEDQAEAKNAMVQLKQALEWLGAGAKTAVGYGRMLEDKGKLSELISKRDAEES
ncbi:MAG: type III-B CRISPR module RAMP protein Cmr6, partial [Methylococcaceae bacterium]